MQAFLWQLARNSLVLWINRVKEHEDSWRACDGPSIETRKLKKKEKKKTRFQQQTERKAKNKANSRFSEHSDAGVTQPHLPRQITILIIHKQSTSNPIYTCSYVFQTLPVVPAK